MDFELDEAQRAIAATAAEALKRAGAAEATGTAEATWSEFAKAGLLALTLPGWLDGDELGADAAGVLLTEVGRRAACVPALATIMLGVLPVVRWADRVLAERLLSGVATGHVLLTAGVREPSAPTPVTPATVAVLPGTAEGRPGSPRTRRRGGPGGSSSLASTAGTVTGTKVGVPYAGESRWILIPATVAGQAAGGQSPAAAGHDRAVVVIEAIAPGVTMTRTPASGGTPEYTVRLDDVPIVGVLPGAAVDDLYLLTAAGAAAVAAGAVAGALDLTAGYVATREQFGRPLATFQAVAQQVADIYITSRTLHLAALSACWRLSSGMDAEARGAGGSSLQASTEDAHVAAYWLATQAPAALRACHHLHGGIGLDMSYPLHRYYGLVKDLVRLVGGADHRLDLLAAVLARGDDLPEPARPGGVRSDRGVACSST